MKGKEKVYEEGRIREKDNIYIGLDASYMGFGLAILSETDAYRIYVYASDGSGVDRLLDIDEWLFDRVLNDTEGRVEDAAIEGYSMGSRYGREMAGELGGLVRYGLRLNPVTINTPARYPMVVAPQSLKKYVLGPGEGTGKSLMLKGVYKRWNVDVNDDNAADAYALARIARKDAVEKYQQEVLAKAKESRPWYSPK